MSTSSCPYINGEMLTRVPKKQPISIIVHVYQQTEEPGLFLAISSDKQQVRILCMYSEQIQLDNLYEIIGSKRSDGTIIVDFASPMFHHLSTFEFDLSLYEEMLKLYHNPKLQMVYGPKWMNGLD